MASTEPSGSEALALDVLLTIEHEVLSCLVAVHKHRTGLPGLRSKAGPHARASRPQTWNVGAMLISVRSSSANASRSTTMASTSVLVANLVPSTASRMCYTV